MTTGGVPIPRARPWLSPPSGLVVPPSPKTREGRTHKVPREVQVLQHLSSGALAELLGATRHMKSTCIKCSLSHAPLSNACRSSGLCAVCMFGETGKRPKFINCSDCGEAMHCSTSTRLDGKAAHRGCRRPDDGCGTRANYDRGCRCEECRSEVARIMREYAKRRKARDGVSPTAKLKRDRKGYSDELMSCAGCGDRLHRVPADGARGYCKPCRLSKPRWLVRGEQGPRQRRARAKIRAAAKGSAGSRLFTQGACSWCGDRFTSAGGSFFCSATCRRTENRKNNGNLGFLISHADRQAIYVRDEWMCQLCRRPVDKELRNPNIWSATLDHVIPQSTMLVPDHSPSNLRLSHLLCNSYRGANELDVHELRALTESRWIATAA